MGISSQALGQLGKRRTDVRAFVLTHADFDHVGFAERARTLLGITVYVHENDVPTCGSELAQVVLFNGLGGRAGGTGGAARFPREVGG